MQTFAIFFNPSDQPGKYVMREFDGTRPTTNFKVADTLDDIRKEIPPGLVFLNRFPENHPTVVETWI